jgi:hypothetical protein
LAAGSVHDQSRVQFQAADAARTDAEVVTLLSADDFAFSISGSTGNVFKLFSMDEKEAGAGHKVKTLCIAKKRGVEAADLKVQLVLLRTVDLNVAVAGRSVSLQKKLDDDVKVVAGRYTLKCAVGM